MTSLVSGQVLNLQKSLIKFSPNIRGDLQHRVKSILSMNSQESLGRYLRVKVEVRGSKLQYFTPLLDRLSTKIAQ